MNFILYQDMRTAPFNCMITYQNTGQQENVYFHKKIATKCKMFSSLQHWHIGTLAHLPLYIRSDIIRLRYSHTLNFP